MSARVSFLTGSSKASAPMTVWATTGSCDLYVTYGSKGGRGDWIRTSASRYRLSAICQPASGATADDDHD